MTPDEITALAREYGEYVANSLDYDMYADPELRHRLVAKGHSEAAQPVLEWLSQRYCLVEKSTIADSYDCAIRRLDGMKGLGSTLADRYYNEGELNGHIDLIESLFPEIAKEVEDA